jgi:orotidine-5'-phosphate decarboxylase
MASDTLTPKDRLIVALDVPTRDEALRFADALGDSVTYVKIGYELFISQGWPIVEEVSQRGLGVFLDLKMDDIPETITRSVRHIASNPAVRLLTIHGGAKTAAAAREGRGARALKLLQVTLLTSLGEEDLRGMFLLGNGWKFRTVTEYVAWRAETALANGADGLIASGQEAAMLRAKCGAAFTLVCPGIRHSGDGVSDHKRAMTPRQAIAAGATQIVVGRPIRDAADPRGKATQIVDEIASAL